MRQVIGWLTSIKLSDVLNIVAIVATFWFGLGLQRKLPNWWSSTSARRAQRRATSLQEELNGASYLHDHPLELIPLLLLSGLLTLFGFAIAIFIIAAVPLLPPGTKQPVWDQWLDAGEHVVAFVIFVYSLKVASNTLGLAWRFVNFRTYKADTETRIEQLRQRASRKAETRRAKA